MEVLADGWIAAVLSGARLVRVLLQVLRCDARDEVLNIGIAC